MEALFKFLNSNFGLLVSGAVISGLIVQYITSSWQQHSWIFQQRYMAEKATFDKELDQKYKLWDEINTAVAAVLAHSRFAIAAYVKAVPEEQLRQQILNYNDAVLNWESDFGLYSIRLKTFFHNEETLKQWESIKVRRDDLDVVIYELSSDSQKSANGALALLEKISDLTAGLSRHMMVEIKSTKSRVRTK